MKFPGLAVLLISIVGIISCQREIEDIFAPAPLPSNDSIYLKQYIEIDTTAARGSDTINKYDFYYDNAKRISGYLLTEYLYNPQLKIYSNVKYYYNGNNTLPYKTTIHIQEGNLIYLDTTFYTYSNGKVLTDSIIFYRQNNQELLYTSTTSYTPSGVNVFLRTRNVSYFRGAPTVLTDSGLVNVTMAGSNISVQTSPPGLLFGAYSKFTYDNKPNPFYRIDIHYPLIGFSTFEAEENNFLSQQTGSDPSNLYYHIVFSYTYRLDGYPITVIKSDLLDPAYTVKGLFYYTN